MMSDAAERAVRVHQAAVKLLPTAAPDYQQVLSVPDRLYLVVEKSDPPCDLDNPAADQFVWLTAKMSVPLRKAFAAYRRTLPELKNDVFRIGDTILSEASRVWDLPPPKDGVLLVKAVKPEPEDDMPSDLSSDVFIGDHIGRPPLQPINRQVTVTSRLSPDDISPKREHNVSPRKDARTGAHAHPSPPSSPSMTTERPLASQATASPGKPSSAPLRPQADGASAQQSLTEPQSEHDFEDDYQPRVLDNLFQSQEDPATDPSDRGGYLLRLVNNDVPERVEVGVKAGLQVLTDLEAPFKKLGDNEDARVWLQSIEKIRQEAVPTRTVVGVVGNTGAGKSSVINAMLDEERLVPTNCMRACTAVVTELSYNHSNSEAAKYRAEIEFIKPEDWAKELRVLFREAFDDNGRVSNEAYNPDSEAGVAFAKIRAVYNKMTREQLARSTIEGLMSNKQVCSVLGTTRRIQSRDAMTFYRSLQNYVDSKEKSQQILDKNGNVNHQAPRPFEHWPLIKVVKIYTKAKALATGAVIVDLPGVHDSNAARAAIAEGYMKQCTGLWIVAPINRAVDDKAAKNLLGDTFKRQLKFDGSYSAVTFICSKTDDISRTEAADSLQLGAKMTNLEDRLATLEKRCSDLEREEREVKNAVKDNDAAMESIEDEIEVWEDLSREVQKGNEVFAPSTKTKKRKAVTASTPTRKRRRRMIDFDDYVDNPSEQESDSNDAQTREPPLTVDVVEEKLEELKQLRRESRRSKAQSKSRSNEINNAIVRLEDDKDAIESEMSSICIAGRNEYSRGAIQQDFAQGIRELDQENAEEEDADNYDPNVDLRDYDEVARSLPVFCVSSRAYQKLSGRLKKDTEVDGFTDARQTEIPQLQDHCRQLTVKGRIANCRRFLNSLKRLIVSLALWSSDDGAGMKLTSQQCDLEKNFLSRRLKELESALEKVVESTLNDASDTLHEQLFNKFAPAAKAAVQEAGPKALSWGAHKSEGGMVWSAYKATVRRHGVYSSPAAGQRDFNNDLAEPIYRHLATIWERVFQRRLPTILQSFKTSAVEVVKKFHEAVERRSRERGTGAARLTLLAQQLDQYAATFGDLCSTAITALNEGQRDINREFVPVITEAMEPAYDYATNESGHGSFNRMKSGMTGHVANHKQAMFETASTKVRDSLICLCRTIQTNMLDKADEVYLLMHKDYTSVLNGVNVDEMKMSREERAPRREIEQLLTNSEQQFEQAAEADLDELKAILYAVGRPIEVHIDSNAGDDDMDDDAFEDLDHKDDDNERSVDGGGQAAEANGEGAPF